MTTKDEFMFLKDKLPSFASNYSHTADSCGQYSNLNLNQNHKCSNFSPVHSNIHPNNNKFCEGTAATVKLPDSTVSDNYGKKEKLPSMQKPSHCVALKQNDKAEKEKKKKWMESISSSATNSSTLSLHIAAYERSVETAGSDLMDDRNNKDLKKGTFDNIEDAKKIFSSTFTFLNPFEFPRQESDEVPDPEISQFRASQRLLNTNEALVVGRPNSSLLQDQSFAADSFQPPSAHLVQQQQRADVPSSIQQHPLQSARGAQPATLRQVSNFNAVEMFHDFIPTGLSPKQRQKYRAVDLYEHLSAAYMGIEERSKAQNRTFNSSHPDAVAILKALDSIFSHRLLNGEKCYWNFAKNFLSVSQQLDLQAEWKTKRNRALSLAWLKDGLNKHTLYFDCTAFSQCKQKILEGYYFKDAFMRNPKLVNQLLEKLDCLMNINFVFHTPVDTTLERVPIALPSTSNEPEELNTSVPQLHSLRRAKILPASPFREVPDVDHSELIAGDLPTSQSLIEMTRDLPRVETRDIPLDEELGNFEANHQYIFDQMTKAHHVTASDTVSEKGSENGTNENLMEQSLPEVSAEGHKGDGLVDSTYTIEDEEKAEEPEPEVAPMVDNFSDVHAADPIPGEFILEPYEVIELGLSIFVDQGERYRKSYSVYTDHAIGRPMQRLFVLTDRRVYLLSYKASEMNDALEATPSPSSLTESRPHAEFRLHAYVHFSDIDCICVGIDYQVFAIECTHKKFSMSYSDHESRNLFVECGSIELTKQLLSSVKQAMIELIGEAPSIFTDGTPSSITLKRFVSNELEITNAPIRHHSLIYWLEYAVTTSELDALEGYLTFREVKHKNWIKPYGEWKYAYFVLKGCMLYQFVDSTCKFAEQKWNLRDFIETVGEVELRNDEQHVFQLTSYEGSTGFQFSCSNMETMRTWIQNINISLSSSNSTPDAVPCSLTISSEWILFAHEGANCAIDGFMRLLKKIDISKITNVTSVHTESVNVIVIEHQSNSTDWIVVRTLSELRRLETTFNIKCGLAVTDSVDEMHFGRDKSNILYKQCAKMHDFWRNAPVSD